MNQSSIRNFSIIAHIDHGKTTLTDQLLLATNTINQRQFHERLLDSNPIEQERGITIKLAPVSLTYTLPPDLVSSLGYPQLNLNLIDTPGHVDFGYEVSRSLAACEGAVLLVDATQGIQAQTLSNFQKAKNLGLNLIVALNKIDLPAADPEAVTLDLVDTLGLNSQAIVSISAKTGTNINALFAALATAIPAPSGAISDPLRCLVFNSIYHPHKGVIAFVKLESGFLSSQDEVSLFNNQQSFPVKELGIFTPQMQPVDQLQAGQVGYIATGFKDVSLVRPGDTITHFASLSQITPLPGYKDPQPVVFMDIYPLEGKEFSLLKEGLEKLALNDASLSFVPSSSLALGKGFRVGFLGVLHAEIVLERIKREYGLDLIPTTPTVVYRVTTTDGQTLEVKNPEELPDSNLIREIQEPLTSVVIYTPNEYLGAIMNLLNDARGEMINQTFYGQKVKLEYLVPLSELIINFYDQLKSLSSGYASLEYELFDYQPVDAVKLSVLINHEPVEALSQILHSSKVQDTAKHIVAKLKDAIPRTLHQIPVQAAVGGQIIARETIKAYRKDVTAKLYGGDITRRKKLLEKQKKGKTKRSHFSKVEIPQSAYLAVLKR